VYPRKHYSPSRAIDVYRIKNIKSRLSTVVPAIHFGGLIDPYIDFAALYPTVDLLSVNIIKNIPFLSRSSGV